MRSSGPVRNTSDPNLGYRYTHRWDLKGCSKLLRHNSAAYMCGFLFNRNSFSHSAECENEFSRCARLLCIHGTGSRGCHTIRSVHIISEKVVYSGGFLYSEGVLLHWNIWEEIMVSRFDISSLLD